MGWVLFIFLQVTVVIAGIRQEQRTGEWSWSKFVFAIGFAALEFVIVSAPLYYFDLKSPRFLPAFFTAWAIAALNFVWMIIVARHWKLSDGRTSLQAYRDSHPK